MPQFFNVEHPLGIWAYFTIAALVMIEGPIATLLGAVAASAGYMKPGWVFAAAAFGNLTADTLWYLIGYLGNIEWVVQYGRYVKLRREQIERMEKEIQAHVVQILFLAKITMGFIIPVLVATGLARIPIRRWFWVLFSGECIWTGGLVIVGFYFGRYIRTLERGLQIFALIGAVFFIILIVRFVSTRRSRSADAEL